MKRKRIIVISSIVCAVLLIAVFLVGVLFRNGLNGWAGMARQIVKEIAVTSSSGRVLDVYYEKSTFPDSEYFALIDCNGEGVGYIKLHEMYTKDQEWPDPNLEEMIVTDEIECYVVFGNLLIYFYDDSHGSIYIDEISANKNKSFIPIAEFISSSEESPHDLKYKCSVYLVRINYREPTTAQYIVESEDEPEIQEFAETSPVMQSYLDFLQNKTRFYKYYYRDWNMHSAMYGGYESMSEYLYQEENIYLIVKEFAVIDMNGDGVLELILSMRHPTSASIREVILVLTSDAGEIYVITFTQRSFSNLKKDGTYISSSVSSGRWGIMKLQYSSGDFWFEEARSPNYYESGEEFSSFFEEQDSKDDAVWFPFVEETLNEDIATAWESNATNVFVDIYGDANTSVDNDTSEDAITSADIDINGDTNTSANNDTSEEATSNAVVDINAIYSEVEVNIYYSDYVQERNRLVLICKPEIISSENMSDDTIRLMKDYNDIEIDRIWYEGIRICIDLNERERGQLNRGSSAGMIAREILLYTFSSYPNVKEIEILINGERGQYGVHFNFEDVFEVKLDDPAGRFY